MKTKIKYTEGPLGPTRRIRDFLPPPGQLVFKEDNVKVTMELSRNSLEFFKKQAKKRRIPYQRMIRNLLDLYVARQKA